MAGGLPKESKNFHKIPDARIAIIASMWHAQYVDLMVARAKQELLKLDVKEENISVHNIPGSLELPYAAQLLYNSQPELDAILAFGIVLKGETTHDTTVVEQVSRGFSSVTERFSKPIINEVIGVAELKDAAKRCADDDLNKGLEAVFAVSELLRWQKSIVKVKRPIAF